MLVMILKAIGAGASGEGIEVDQEIEKIEITVNTKKKKVLPVKKIKNIRKTRNTRKTRNIANAGDSVTAAAIARVLQTMDKEPQRSLGKNELS